MALISFSISKPKNRPTHRTAHTQLLTKKDMENTSMLFLRETVKLRLLFKILPHQLLEK
jgi:hypothetical protein